MLLLRVFRNRLVLYRPSGTLIILASVLLILNSRTVNSDSNQTENTIELTILPSKRMTVQALSARLDSCQTLAARQRLGLRLLKDDAEKTQEPILNMLSELEAQGLASNIESRIVPNSVIAKVTQEGLARLSSLSNVAEIRESAPLRSSPVEDVPEYESKPSASRAGVEDNLRFIGADSMWQMGYTGKGRIVAHFDGGNIYHPAIGPKWKGWDGDTASAWHTTRPWLHPVPFGSGHGTNTFGILVGCDSESGDTIGIAIDSRWIADGDETWNWLVNPDGDLNTTGDMPDVLVWSRGLGPSCNWSEQGALEIVEALGITVVFAASNWGPAPESIGGLGGAIAIDSLTNFSVGSVDHRNATVWWSSSRGPSPCDGSSIKPNLSAPGANVRSASQSGGYSTIGGTSFAAPHVAGAISLLRQAFPNTMTRQIKEALLAGATPAGSTTPNNDYGWGILNIPSAYRFLEERGNAHYAIEVAQARQTVIGSEDSLRISFTFQNRGRDLQNVVFRSDQSQNGFTCAAGIEPLGDMKAGSYKSATVNIVFDDTLCPGQTVPFRYHITANGVDLPEETLEFTVGGKHHQRFYTHNTGKIRYSITNTSQSGYGFGEVERFDWIVGFRLLNRYGNLLRESSLFVGTDSLHVSDGAHTSTIEKDNDWWGSNLDTLELLSTDRADEETRCAFWDGAAEHPLGISVEQRTMSFKSEPDDRFVLLEYRLRNRSTNRLKDIFAGMFMDWEIGSYNPDKGLATYRFDEQSKTAYNHYPEFHQHLRTLLGTSIVSDHLVSSARAIERGNVISDYGISESQKYEFLAGRTIDTSLAEVLKDNLAYLISVGPFDLDPGEEETVAFAIVTGDSPEHLRSVAERAHLRYRHSTGSLPLPEQFAVSQNYPNPFNSSTVIPVEIKLPGHTRVEIFNVLGQRVRTLVDKDLGIGMHRVEWVGDDATGKSVASGIYFAKVSFENASVVKKLLLLK